MKTTTLALALRSFGFTVEQHDGFLKVEAAKGTSDLWRVLTEIAEGHDVDPFANPPSLMFERYHPYLTQDLLQDDALSARLQRKHLQSPCQRLLGRPS